MPTENGWEPSPRIEPGSPLLVWRTVPGTDVSLQVRDDDAGTAMLAYAADYHAFIEPLRDADSCCYTPTNSVDTSNHLNATAFDLNWNSHPFQVADAGYDAAKIGRMRDLLAYYRGIIFWANDWDSPKDAMHHQMDYGSYADPNISARNDPEGYRRSVAVKAAALRVWVQTHIRADGFSTYKRGGTPIGGGTPVVDAGNSTRPPADDAATVLYDAVPVIDEARAAELLGPLRAGLAAADCTNPKRIAMALAQWGHESDGFKTTREYGTGQRYAPFIGRTWIQITWQSNYAAFGKWAAAQGLIDDPDYFVKNPAALEDLKWAGIGAAWYWTVARPQINSLCDAGDLVGVTQAINGGQNGIDDRRTRYNQAIALGDRLLLLTQPSTDQGDDFMSALPADVQQKVAEAILRIDANVAWLRAQLDATDFGPDSSMGKTADGKELTVRDGLAEDKRNVEALLVALTAPGVAVVQLQAAPAAAKKAAAKASS